MEIFAMSCFPDTTMQQRVKRESPHTTAVSGTHGYIKRVI